jgi:hypothetical protein
MWATSVIIKKLTTVSNRQLGKNSPNLVTLLDFAYFNSCSILLLTFAEAWRSPMRSSKIIFWPLRSIFMFR